jgi:hypothetical protein
MYRKLIVRLKGGLGNQLFCYAAARRLALVNDAELVLDVNTGFKYDYLYRRRYALGMFSIPERLATQAEQMEPFGRLRRLIARKISAKKPLAQRRYIQQVGVDFDPDILSLRLQNGITYFDAFGQSELYFSDTREQILKDLVMPAFSDDDNLEMAKHIKECPSVALHVRWFDAGDAAKSSNMSLTYYANAIKAMLLKIDHAHFFIFSDRPDEAAKLLSPLLKDKKFTVVTHNVMNSNPEADFWLMRQCRHFIIGNSTFAWWAAWLGEQLHKGTQVFAPARNVDPHSNVTAWGFPGLLPDRWNVL